MEQYLSVPNFFVFSEQNLINIYENIFYLVKWGFSRNEIKDMPIMEYLKYIRLMNEYYEKKNKSYSSSKEIMKQDAPGNPAARNLP